MPDGGVPVGQNEGRYAHADRGDVLALLQIFLLSH
jgi:hypothetical protein